MSDMNVLTFDVVFLFFSGRAEIAGPASLSSSRRRRPKEVEVDGDGFLNAPPGMRMVGRSFASNTGARSDAGVSSGLELELAVSLCESAVNSGHGAAVEPPLSRSVVETVGRGGLGLAEVLFLVPLGGELRLPKNCTAEATSESEVKGLLGSANDPLSHAPTLTNALVRPFISLSRRRI